MHRNVFCDKQSHSSPLYDIAKIYLMNALGVSVVMFELACNFCFMQRVFWWIIFIWNINVPGVISNRCRCLYDNVTCSAEHLTKWSFYYDDIFKCYWKCLNFCQNFTTVCSLRCPIEYDNIGSGNGLMPSGTKPLHEPILARFYHSMWLWHTTMYLNSPSAFVCFFCTPFRRTWACIHKTIRRLVAKSREVSKTREWKLELSYRPENLGDTGKS